MKKKFAAALSGVATLTMALSACGSSSSKIDDYAKSVCDQVQPQLQKIQNANNSIASVAGGDSKSEDVKSSDSAAFQQISNAYKALSNAVTSAGAPPVKDGATLQHNAVNELNSISTAYANLKKTVDGLNTGDQAAFAGGLKGVAGQLATLGKGGDDALSKLQSGDVGKAMAKQPGCQKASNSPTTGPGTLASPAASPSPAALQSQQSQSSQAPAAGAAPSASASASASASQKS